MKRLILAVMLAGLGLGQASASDYVFVKHGSERHQIRNVDMETMSVCSLMQRVASRLGLEMRKFHLTQGGGPLNEGKTLSSVHLSRGSVLQIKEVRSSNQCT